LLRLGLVTALIVLLAFAGMASSLFIADTLKGAAAAVNQAGTLRMQSYRIATHLAYGGAARRQADGLAALMEEFEQRLASPRLIQVIPADPEQRLGQQYAQVAQLWHTRIQPLLSSYLSVVAAAGPMPRPSLAEPADGPESVPALPGDIREAYLSWVADFVGHIDDLVGALEQDAEAKITRLRGLQWLALVLTLLVAGLGLYLVHTRVRLPLYDLLRCAEQARRGDFRARPGYRGDDELGRLGQAFDVMAEDLSKLYRGLEERVREKTAALARSNQSLELLYATVKRLNEAPLDETTYRALLEDIATRLGHGLGTLCLSAAGQARLFRFITTRPVEAGRPDPCTLERCAECRGEGTTHRVAPAPGAQSPRSLLSIPIRDNEQHYGLLLVELSPDKEPQPWEIRLLETVARHIGIAINISHCATRDRQVALLEERATIARELHDSLAQSLSYLKIQVSRLDAALRRPDGLAAARPIIDGLREGLNAAYRQLREILTTFRLKIDGRDFRAALTDAIQELQGRSEARIDLEYGLSPRRLSANEQIHVLQVIREALSNALRHAQASKILVRVSGDPTSEVAVAVEDDGIGLSHGQRQAHHYGLAIMQERARSLGGALVIGPRAERGTRLHLVFWPGGRGGTELPPPHARPAA